ncbi:MAG: Phytochrome-like protein cph2 [Alphaproteobacteria bacterium MarineAlpha3_Bin4]|nr:MAG: Phytochrome-like protein cph2 [Alphaproteobacteria bacterium MarineAlpha3_Bin4]
MAKSKTVDVKTKPPLNGHSRLLDNYPGPALLMAEDGTVIHSNDKGADLEVRLQNGTVPEIVDLISIAAAENAVAAGTVSLENSYSENVLDVTVVPQATDDRLVVLVRDLTMERNLRYIVSTIRGELDPHNMLAVAARATVRVLSVAGCRIYRQNESGAFTIAAEYGNTQGLDGLDNCLGDINDNSPVISINIDSWQVLTASTNYRQTINGAFSIWRHDKGTPWDDDHRQLINEVANHLGITNEQVSNHERILALSRTNGITGLLNRRAFCEEELPRRFSRLSHSRQTAALFYVDMDNFKLVNDVHGHQRGDDAILFLRDMLIKFSRPGDVIARLGGDEFAMWLDGVTLEVTKSRAEALIKASREMQQFSGSEEKPLGLSVGVAVYDPDFGEEPEEMLARADAAMYVVKKAGKGGYHLAPLPEPKSG